MHLLCMTQRPLFNLGKRQALEVLPDDVANAYCRQLVKGLRNPSRRSRVEPRPNLLQTGREVITASPLLHARKIAARSDNCPYLQPERLAAFASNRINIRSGARRGIEGRSSLTSKGGDLFEREVKSECETGKPG